MANIFGIVSKSLGWFQNLWYGFRWDHRQTAQVNMKTKISFNTPVCWSCTLFEDILYGEGSKIGDPDGDEMFACGGAIKNIRHRHYGVLNRNRFWREGVVIH